MSDVDAKIAALEEAIDSGAKKITFRSGGTMREIEYRSHDDLLQALARLKVKNRKARTVTLASL